MIGRRHGGAIMGYEETSAIVQAHADELRARGVKRLALFGSSLRGEEHTESDVDLLIDFQESARPSLIDFAELRLRLCDLLGRDVDLVMRERLKPYVRDAILAEARDLL